MHFRSVDTSNVSYIWDYCGDCQHHFQLTEKKVMGQSTIWKDYLGKVFEIIRRRHPSGSMILAVNDYY